MRLRPRDVKPRGARGTHRWCGTAMALSAPSSRGRAGARRAPESPAREARSAQGADPAPAIVYLR